MAVEEVPSVRAVVDGFRFSNATAPYDTGRLKVLYPSTDTPPLISEVRREGAPFPVVLFAGGAFVEANRYQWLGEYLVRKAGVVFVVYDILDLFGNTTAIVSDIPGSASLTTASPGISHALDVLQRLNSTGVLNGALDLNRIVLGGHSSGGRIVLNNANEEYVPGVVGAFSYGAHTAAGPRMGHPPATILPVRGEAPLLIMGGSLDGVVDRGSAVYGTQWKSSLEPVRRTYDEALEPGRCGYFAGLRDFNHFAIVDPVDRTLGSSLLDHETTVEKAKMTRVLSRLVKLFVRATAFEDTEAEEKLRRLLSSEQPYLSDADFKVCELVR